MHLIDPEKFFVKTGPAGALQMFEAEAEGLRELSRAGVIRIPEVHDCGIDDGTAFIAMERLRFRSASSADEQALGEQLAELHRVTHEQFGWHRDNTIGLTPQRNTPADDWCDFYATERLGFQLSIAANKGYGGELQAMGEQLLERLPAMFAGHEPQASLLHGDLWGGNWAATDEGPAIFDPAVYYGDRETDLAMSRLFGGFGRSFYQAYEAAWPLPRGHEQRNTLYQLYHVINHVNLFGGGYLGQALRLMKALL
jgi:fructosamine-3-kinase